MADIQLLLEAEKRGLLPPDKVALLNEARSRGLIASNDKPVEQPIEQPKAEPTLLERFKRQAGLTGRYAMEGLGDVAGIVGNPISALTGGVIPRPSESMSRLANSLDLPSPETDQEKLVGAVSRGVVGAGTMAGTGNLIAQSPGMVGKIGTMLAAQPAAQMASGGGSAAGSEIARQAGGGEGAQLAAGIAGGLAPNAIVGAAKLAGKTASHVLGLTTGAGAESVKQAAKAGFEGGKNAETFTANMRGNVPKDSVLDAVDANIQAMGRDKSLAYQTAMEKLGKDQKVLDFANINKAANEAMDISTFTGPQSGITVSTAKSTLPMQKKISALLNQWQKLPDDFRTAAGLDALKKNLGDLRDSADFGTPSRLAADKVYHAVKNEIVKQAPDYAKTMKDYQQASDLMSEIRSTLSNKPTASVDTQMRKLQSLMRNNVNTNYGNRLDLVKAMEQQGGNSVIPAIAGQALNTWTPRGLQSATTIPAALGGAAVGGAGLGAAMLPMAMPRVVGEGAYKVGQGAGLANKLLGKTVNKNKLSALLNATMYGGMAANQK